MLKLLLIVAVSFLTSLFISAACVWVLKTFKIGQRIREEGPAGHKIKVGTPTMGGLAIILTVFILSLILIDTDLNLKITALLTLLLGYSIIGLTDDLIKFFKMQNQGLEGKSKLILQFVSALIFSITILYLGHHTSVSGILKILRFDILWLYLPFILFMIIGAANATNLTDGLDGLLAGSLIPAFFVYGIIAQGLFLEDLAIFAMILTGAVLAFLLFNFHPARVFMGDVGSVGLGSALAGLAILTHKELLLIVIGGIFVIETLSVIAQVVSFKLTGRRIFKMSPLHHHFELSGWSEWKIVLLFWIGSIIFSGLGLWLSTLR